jgi:hypothetical protein
MHKVLKDYLATSRGDLLTVVGKIKEMVLNQYSRYRKDIGTAQHTIRSKQGLKVLPFLPENIHQVVTPAALDLLRKQFELHLESVKTGKETSCTGNHSRVYGLPCWHQLRVALATESSFGLDYFEEDHWRYKRQQGPSMIVLPRPHQLIRDPVVVRDKRASKRTDGSTRRDLSVFERPVPPSQTSQVSKTARPSSFRVDNEFYPAPSFEEAITSIHQQVGIPAPADPSAWEKAPKTAQRGKNSRQKKASTPQPAQTPPQPSSPELIEAKTPTLDEFISVLNNQLPAPDQAYRNPRALDSYLDQAGLKHLSQKYQMAIHMATATRGSFAYCTPKMAYYAMIEDDTSYQNALLERNAQGLGPIQVDWTWDEANTINSSPDEPSVSSSLLEAQLSAQFETELGQNVSGHRLKRQAAQEASAAWDDLRPKQRQRT